MFGIIKKIIRVGSIILAISLINCSNDSIKKPGTSVSKDSIINVVSETKKNEAWTPLQYDTTKHYIYLTFDDGPQNGTSTCFNICKRLQVKATFFMVGTHVKSTHQQQLVDSIKQGYPNILLANHSFTHANDHYKYFYHHPSIAELDFYTAQKSLKVPFKIIRLPGNSAWVRKNELKATSLVKPVCSKLDSAGYNVIGWDFEWHFSHDGKARPVRSATYIANSIQETIAHGHGHSKKHFVILMHDRMFQRAGDADSLYKMITLLQKDSTAIFETVDHYPNLKMP